MQVQANQAPGARVILAGLDIGSTTTSILAASARIAMNCVTGRQALSGIEIVCRPDPVFTPFEDGRIALNALRKQIEIWLDEAGLQSNAIFSSGALVTGLAAKSENAGAISELVRELLGESVVATADDPRLESWLAFMGSAASLSRARPRENILNLDIGGGTTNSAVGLDGNVLKTGCHFIGARHLRFRPGTYVVTGMSRYGRAIFDELGIRATEGETMDIRDVERVTNYFVSLLDAIVSGNQSPFKSRAGKVIEQVALRSGLEPAVVTYSGGVGELVYSAAGGMPLPPTTYYGDLGIDLARAILKSPLLAKDVQFAVPENKGRATVHGLTLHNVDVSGTTLFLPRPDLLPMRDLPILASLPATTDASGISAALEPGGNSTRGVCLQISFDDANPSLEVIRWIGAQLASALGTRPVAENGPVVILTSANSGKAIGNYATNWQQRNHNLIVIDEVPLRAAQFVSIGGVRHGLVPVTFYGIK